MQFVFEEIGTHWQIDIEGDVAASVEQQLLNRIRERIAVFDKHYSRFRADSLITTMSKQVGTYELPADAKPMLDLYWRLYGLTGGAMTPLIGQVLSDAGYDADYSLQTRELHRPPAWDTVLDYAWPVLTLHQPALLDFGACGKGYLVDIVAELIRDAGYTEYTVDAGGDIRHASAAGKTLRVGLENPNDTTTVLGVVTLGNRSMCGSAGNRRAWGNFHHIINPTTLTSPRDIAAVWAIADTTLLADAMTTALYFTPAAGLTKHFTFEYLILKADFTVERSPNFPAELFTDN